MANKKIGYLRSGSLAELIQKCNTNEGAYRVRFDVLTTNSKIEFSAIMVVDLDLCAKIVDGVDVYRKCVDGVEIAFHKEGFDLNPQLDSFSTHRNCDYTRLNAVILEHMPVKQEIIEKKSKDIDEKISFVEAVKRFGMNCSSAAALGVILVKLLILTGSITASSNALMLAAVISVGIYVVYSIVLWALKYVVDATVNFFKNLHRKKPDETGATCTVFN